MQMYIGIDWSESKHDVMFVNENGGQISYQSVPHSLEGFQKIDEMRQKLNIERADCLLGLETAHNLVIDYLWTTGYSQVYVLAPNMVNKSRERYRQSGARNDRSDAYVIADLLRTDVHRFYPWSPGSDLLRQMRTATSAAQFWTKQVVLFSNRLRNVLLRYYPAALATFKSWPSLISCHLIINYPTPQAGKALTLEEFQHFAKRHRYTLTRQLPGCYERLQADYPPAEQAWIDAYQGEAVQLATMLLAALRNKQHNLAHLQSLFQQHPDSSIFASLPGTGDLLAPALLVKFGEDRERFPTSALIQALAGTCPVTSESGKHRSIRFRRACDKDFRYFAQQFAMASSLKSTWAAAYLQETSQRTRSYHHAVRCLANRWLAIIWKCWQERKPYDETYHLQQRAARRKPIS